MFTNLANWWALVKAEFNAATTAETKREVLAQAKTLVDDLLQKHPIATKIADALIHIAEASIK